MPHPTDDETPKNIATPEGDNEDFPNEPLKPLESDVERPRGDEPHTKLPLRDAL
jgi:hypothetical protein